MIKRIINKLGRMSPDIISRWFVYIPFRFRERRAYRVFKRKIKESDNWSEKEREDYILENFNNIFQHSKKFKLYREKYKKSGVLDLDIKSLEDIKKIPILTKDEIKENIEDFNGYYSQNTGGTSGAPAAIYLDKDAWAREWAHYHSIWENTGYTYTDAKFIFRGLDLKDDFIRYYFEGNEYNINIYKNAADNIDEFFKVLTTRNITFFQGYPSAINNFLKELDTKISIEQKERLKKQIKCCFYSSEYPTSQITEYLKKEWELDFLSCYGHSEQCVLAAANINQLDYIPLYTYGYVEVENNMLIGTSYHNFDMPLIRYNTDDLVRPKRYENGVVKSFEIKEGRIGDFIFDKNDNQISLTALIFGRHHKIFNYIDYIQVFQEKNGRATFLISQNNDNNLNAMSLMNLENIEIDFDFIYLKNPVKTLSGKVALRVKKLPA